MLPEAGDLCPPGLCQPLAQWAGCQGGPTFGRLGATLEGESSWATREIHCNTQSQNISYCFKYIDGFVSGRVWDAPGNSLSSVSTLGRQQGSPQWKRVLSHLWDPRSEVRVQRGLERLQRRAFLPFPAPGGSWCPLACGHLTPVPDPTFLRLLLFCLF